MKLMRLIHNGRGTRVPVRVCESFRERLTGLLSTRRGARHGLLKIQPCNAIHTCGMREPIDVVFTLADGTIVRCVQGVVPWRFARCAEAFAAWEMNAGYVRALELRVGQRLEARAPVPE